MSQTLLRLNRFETGANLSFWNFKSCGRKHCCDLIALKLNPRLAKPVLSQLSQTLLRLNRFETTDSKAEKDDPFAVANIAAT